MHISMPIKHTAFITINEAKRYSRPNEVFIVKTARGWEWWKTIGYGEFVDGMGGVYWRYEFKVLCKAGEGDWNEANKW